MVKIDFKKAYDSVEWDCLRNVMIAVGFPMRFVGWIMLCISSMSYSILLNGSPLKPFSAKKGLRLGHPLFSFCNLNGISL